MALSLDYWGGASFFTRQNISFDRQNINVPDKYATISGIFIYIILYELHELQDNTRLPRQTAKFPDKIL